MLSGNNDNNYNHNCRYFRERRVENGRVRVCTRVMCVHILLLLRFVKNVCAVLCIIRIGRNGDRTCVISTSRFTPDPTRIFDPRR